MLSRNLITRATLNIRRNTTLAQSKVDDFLYELKSREWARKENLLAPDASLEKYKVIAKNVLGANGLADRIVKLDEANEVILKAKSDFWAAAVTMDDQIMKLAADKLKSMSKNEFATLSTEFNTKLDQLNDEIIRISVASVVYKGNQDQEAAIDARKDAILDDIQRARAAKLTTLNVNDNPLMQLAEKIYDNKKEIWSWQINPDIDTVQRVVREATQSQLNQLTEAYNQLDKYTKATQGEHVLPKFNIDVQNELVVNAKTNVWLAIEDANREAAAYYFNQGLKPLSDGATLNIRQMVPNLDTINWAAKAWAKEQKLRVEQYNKEVDAADIKRMQEALKKLDLYDGPITGKYDKDFLMDVVFFQQLVVMGAVEGSVKASLDDIATDGKITKSLLNLAQNATIVNPDRVIPGFGREMMQAIHKGRVEQIEANIDEYAELASRLNPFSSRLYTETLPGMAKVLTEISRNSTLQAELNKAMANTLMKDYVEPMKQMYDFAVHVATGKATYGEAKQFGRNLEKVLEGIAIACLTEGVGAALAKVAPKLVEGLADAGKAIVKRKAEEEVVKGGPGVNTPIDEFDDSEIYEGAGASRYNYTKVVDLENSIRYESKEHGQFFDSDGNSNGVMIIGTENSIDLSPYRKLGKNAVFTHNHPKNRTFSWQDLETAIEFDMAEIRAVSPNGATISMKRGAKGWTIDSRSAFDVLKDTQSIFRNDPEIQELYKAGKMDEINDILMREVARKIGGEYTALRK